jgi:hypothetical protein
MQGLSSACGNTVFFSNSNTDRFIITMSRVAK